MYISTTMCVWLLTKHIVLKSGEPYCVYVCMCVFAIMYRRAGNFRLEKIFAQARRRRKIFWRIILPSEKFVTLKFTRIRGYQAVLLVQCLMIINQMFYLVFKTSFSICSLAWCHYCRTSTLHLRFWPILRDPYHWTYCLPPSHRPTLLWTTCSKLRSRKLRSDRSIVPRIVRTVRACEYSTSTWARTWRVHSRAPPTTSWWATCTVGEVKFGEIIVPIESMSIERNFYPTKILCYTVAVKSIVNYWLWNDHSIAWWWKGVIR